MTSKLNNKTSELDIIIAAKKENWQKIQKDVQLKLIKKLSIKGFRKGKVPLEIGKRHISQAEVMQESVTKIISSLEQEAKKLIDKKTMVLSGPSYAISKISDVDLEVKFSYPVFPDFKIGDYKNLETKFISQKVNETDINKELEKMRTTQTMLIDKESNIEKGNVAIFDFEGFIDEKAFKGGKADKFQLEIGSGQFIPGFEEKMIGLKKNDKKNIQVTFPKDYHDANVKGKEATFKVFIHEVKFKQVPKLDDDFAKTSGIVNVKNLLELKSYIKKNLSEQYKQNAESKFQRLAFDEILKKTKDLIVPEILVNKETEALRDNLIKELKNRNMDYKQYLQISGSDEKIINSNFRDQSLARLQDAFIFSQIAKLEKIESSEEDYNKQYEKIARMYSQNVKDVKQMFTQEQIQIMVMNKKVIEMLIKNTK